MNKHYVVGQVNSPDGQFDTEQNGFRSTGSAHFSDTQPAKIDLTAGHSWNTPDVIGRVVGLFRARGGAILCVAELRDDAVAMVADGRWFMSAGVASPRSKLIASSWHGDFTTLADCEIRHVALCERPAVNVRQVQLVPMDISVQAGGLPHNLDGVYRRAVVLAGETLRARRYRTAPSTMQVVDLDPTPAEATPMTTLRRSDLVPSGVDHTVPAEFARSTGGHHVRKNAGFITAVR